MINDNELREGLEFIVGTWQPDFIVNLLSNDLAHIPAAEFKNNDGSDFTTLSFEFFEDNTMKLSYSGKNICESGTWEQLESYKYRYHIAQFEDIPEGPFKDAAEEFSVQEGRLVFAIGFLVVAMNKTAEGKLTEEKKADIGDIEPSEADLAMKDIVGQYAVDAMMTMVGNDFGMYKKAEVEADLKKQLEAGAISDEEYNSSLRMFNTVVEFTEDHKMIEWVTIPVGVTEEQIKAALDAGEIAAVKDGMFTGGEKEWKAVGGKYYYNTGEHRELFGEVLSPWDEIVIGEDGTIPLSGGMMKVRKI